MTNEEIRAFVASRAGDPAFRRWLDTVMPHQPSEDRRATGPLTIRLNYPATDRELEHLRAMAREVSDATGRVVTVDRSEKGVRAMIEARAEEIFGRQQ